jgi:hypothetical protein
MASTGAWVPMPDFDPDQPLAGMPLETWRLQEQRLPQDGAVLLATFDDQTVVVYQAFRRSIADEAVADQRFGAKFSLTRMSWIKPGFLWMMYRSGWASKEDQQRILAVRVRRDAFDRWLAGGVPSSFDGTAFPSSDAWKAAVQRSSVRVQWDPDHDPAGKALARRAVQIGLRGPALVEYSSQAIVAIDDITVFVHDQHRHVVDDTLDDLVIPRQELYPRS